MLKAFGDAIPDLLVSGGDLFAEGLGFARKRVPKASFVQMDARCVPVHGKLDVIGCFDMLEHQSVFWGHPFALRPFTRVCNKAATICLKRIMATPPPPDSSFFHSDFR